MRTLFDQLAKKVLDRALAPSGRVDTDAEVVASEVQRVGVMYAPDPSKQADRRPLGVLGKMACAPCLFEPFHGTVGTEDVYDCLRKQLALHHIAVLTARRESRPIPVRPKWLWILSAGRPERVMDRFELRPLKLWPRGFYGAAEALEMRVVVLSELPLRRATLLLRLLGSGQTLARAVSELDALPGSAIERSIAMPVLVDLRLTIAGDPALRSEEEQELVMSTLPMYEEWKRRIEEEGCQHGLRKAIIGAYSARFGAVPPELKEALDRVNDLEELTRLVSLVATSNPAEIARTLEFVQTGSILGDPSVT